MTYLRGICGKRHSYAELGHFGRDMALVAKGIEDFGLFEMIRLLRLVLNFKNAHWRLGLSDAETIPALCVLVDQGLPALPRQLEDAMDKPYWHRSRSEHRQGVIVENNQILVVVDPVIPWNSPLNTGTAGVTIGVLLRWGHESFQVLVSLETLQKQSNLVKHWSPSHALDWVEWALGAWNVALDNLGWWIAGWKTPFPASSASSWEDRLRASLCFPMPPVRLDLVTHSCRSLVELRPLWPCPSCEGPITSARSFFRHAKTGKHIAHVTGLSWKEACAHVWAMEQARREMDR